MFKQLIYFYISLLERIVEQAELQPTILRLTRKKIEYSQTVCVIIYLSRTTLGHGGC